MNSKDFAVSLYLSMKVNEAISDFLGGLADDVTKKLEVSFNGDLGAAEDVTLKLVYLFFALLIVLFLVSHKVDKAKQQPKRKVVKQWKNASGVENTKQNSESKANPRKSTASYTRIQKRFVGNAVSRPREQS